MNTKTLLRKTVNYVRNDTT